tara:strand:- start:2755 stop:3507 length:753 start_codon:yes stop_codon:yes gene_type:complete
MKNKMTQYISIIILMLTFIWLFSTYQLFNGNKTLPELNKETISAKAITNSKETINLAFTANLRKNPTIESDLIAILPSQTLIKIVAKDPQEKWFYVHRIDSTNIAGWLQAVHITNCNCVQDIPFAETVEVPVILEKTDTPKVNKPDLIIYESSILQSNKILITLGNVGNTSLINQTFGIKLSKISGEIIGIIEFGPDDIIKNKYTTFIVPIVLKESGLHIIHIDYLNEIDEVNEENNTVSQVYLINQNND